MIETLTDRNVFETVVGGMWCQCVCHDVKFATDSSYGNLVSTEEECVNECCPVGDDNLPSGMVFGYTIDGGCWRNCFLPRPNLTRSDLAKIFAFLTPFGGSGAPVSGL